MSRIFADFDFSDFWEESDYANEEYVAPPPTEESVAAIERELGFKLPAAYIEFAKPQNGGIPRRRNHPAAPNSWAVDHVAIHGIFSIDSRKECSVCGGAGSQFFMNEWGYPPIGVYFADCPSAGHDMLCLDYRKCGPTGEPQVVHVDQELDYKITFVAENFEAFVRGLQDGSAFEAI